MLYAVRLQVHHPTCFVWLRSVHYYDKDLFEGVAHNISNNFTKFDTAQLLKVH